MKIFQTVRSNFAILGISSISVFLVYVAKSFEEYTNSIYITSVSVALFVTLSFLVRRMANLFEFIDNLDKIVDESEYNTHYGDA